MDTQSSKENEDSLDNFILLIKNNIKTIIKAAPATIGFFLFLIYFCKYQFFPSFDLFSLGSLLIAASILGLLVFALITFGISTPGLFWVDIFLKDKDVSEDFSYALPKNDEKKKKVAQLRIIRAYFFLPATLCAYTNIYAILSEHTYASYMFGAPFVICLFLAIGLRCEYGLSIVSLLKFSLASLLSFALSSFISLAFCIVAIKAHIPGESDLAQTLLALFITITMTITFTVCAIAFQNFKYSHTIFFSMIFAFLLSIISNLWGTLPDGIAKALGIGNYVALEIHIKGEPCKIKNIPWKDNKNNSCSLTNTKVIWSLGDTYRLRITTKNKTRDLSIPTSNIVSVIKPVKNSDIKKVDISAPT